MRNFKELEKFIKDEIAEIEADERYHYATASVLINDAPLALIQTEMKAKLNAYKSVLEKIKELEGVKDE